MILPDELCKRIEEICTKNDRLEKALAYAIEEVKNGYAFACSEGLRDQKEIDEIVLKINRIKEGSRDDKSSHRTYTRDEINWALGFVFARKEMREGLGMRFSKEEFIDYLKEQLEDNE